MISWREPNINGLDFMSVWSRGVGGSRGKNQIPTLKLATKHN